MCYHFYQEDKMLAELKRETERTIKQKRLLSALPHHSVGRHIAGRLGAYLVTAGTWLERLEQRHASAVQKI